MMRPEQKKSPSDRKPIPVTRPFLPPLAEFIPYLERIWESRWVTNGGPQHQELERALCRYLNVPFISLFNNGTNALLTALQALDLPEGSEVVTTPFSFVATAHAIKWNRLTPVFSDVEPTHGNLDPATIEAAITPRTRAILPVHVYGNPCDTAAIADIAERHDLKVLYDAAHLFGVTRPARPPLRDGDLSVLSFHATKVFGTFEGGAIVCSSEAMKKRIDSLKNFGFTGETTVAEVGMNGKMNEVQAAFGLLALTHIDEALARRRAVAERYTAALAGIPGIGIVRPSVGVTPAWPYFPITVEAAHLGKSRDDLFEEFKRHDILPRRYFYPLISSFAPYRDLPSAAPEKLPVAARFAEQVLCLPIFPDITGEEIERTITVIKAT